jgi:dihydrofolate reductase
MRSLDEAINIARSEGETEAFVIGGASLYKAALPQTDRLYLTLVHASTKADVFFPEFEEGEWVETQREEYPSDEKNQYPTTFRILNRKAKN